MKKSIFIFILFLLAGCDETKSKDWYKEHVDQMKSRQSECKATGNDSQDCRNAKEAFFEWEQLHAKVPNLNDL